MTIDFVTDQCFTLMNFFGKQCFPGYDICKRALVKEYIQFVLEKMFPFGLSLGFSLKIKGKPGNTLDVDHPNSCILLHRGHCFWPKVVLYIQPDECREAIAFSLMLLMAYVFYSIPIVFLCCWTDLTCLEPKFVHRKSHVLNLIFMLW